MFDAVSSEQIGVLVIGGIVTLLFTGINGIILFIANKSRSAHKKKREKLEKRFTSLEEAEERVEGKVDKLKIRLDENEENDKRDKKELEQNIEIAVLKAVDKLRDKK